MRTDSVSESLNASLRPAALGLVLAVLTILFGQGMGVVFGLNEDAIKDRLKSSAATVRDTAYKGDDAAVKAVLDKSWAYMQRAHLHAGGMGTTALGLVGLLCLLGSSRRTIVTLSVGLGAGGLGYSIYWMWAGFRAPRTRWHGCRKRIAQVAGDALLRRVCPGDGRRARVARRHSPPATAWRAVNLFD